ncbi:unnamed protein product [Heterobilharzia americana]|nr:unnamed protein product [Heterobilharzia americana]
MNIKRFSVIIAIFGTFSIVLITLTTVIKQSNQNYQEEQNHLVLRGGIMFSSILMMLVLVMLGQLHHESQLFKDDEVENESIDKTTLMVKESKDDTYLLAA